MRNKMGQFWAIPQDIMAMKSLDIYAKCVYAVLWTRRNGENEAWPGQDSIAESLGVSTRTVRRAIANLEKADLIRKTRIGKKVTNRYYLLESDRTDSPLTRGLTVRSDRTDSHFHSKRTVKRTNKITEGLQKLSFSRFQ